MKENGARFEKSLAVIQSCRSEMAKRIVAQEALVDGILTGFIAGGHVLLEGVPGLAKTLAVKTFAELSSLVFKRIQFTPDLLPADLVGTLVYEQANMAFSVRKGPVFANLVLADEINRAPAKVQSALLEAMAERQVTIGDTSYRLPDPFFVLATQNPIEQEGTYMLPEAELDRFLLKLLVPYPRLADEAAIVRASAVSGSLADGLTGARNTAQVSAAQVSAAQVSARSAASLKQVITAADLADIRADVAAVRCDDAIVTYLVSLVAASRPLAEAQRDKRQRDDYLKYISFGASPRASIALALCARINAFFDGRDFVIPEDVKAVALPVLRHRLVLSYEAGADGLSSDDIISKILGVVPLP
jgi:MoxR-like ATPase